MHMVKSNIRRRDTENKTGNEKIDLDEKIRRIKEQNKVLEKRHKEIEDDKLQALLGIEKTHNSRCWGKELSSNPEDGQGKTVKKGVLATEKKTTKGRGQRLMEISHEPLKASEFEAKAREHFNLFNKETLPEESKISSNAHLPIDSKRNPKKAGYYTNERSHSEKKKVFPPSDILSCGNNPLMDSRHVDMLKMSGNKANEYLRKKEGSKRPGGSGEWSKFKMKEITGEQRGKQDKFIRHEQRGCIKSQKEIQGSSWKPVEQSIMKEITSQEKELTISEDWSREVMDLDEYKIEIPDEISRISQQLQEQLEAAPKYCQEGKEHMKLSEDNGIKKDQLAGDECKPPVVTQRLQEQLPAVPQDFKEDKVNAKLSDIGIEKEEELGGKYHTIQTLKDEPQRQEKTLKEQVKSFTSEEEKFHNQKSKPKITIDTKSKQRPSTKSFDEFMSTLSPLDIPTNWGDCDIDENFDPVF